jgi:hypothetical protein
MTPHLGCGRRFITDFVHIDLAYYPQSDHGILIGLNVEAVKR